MRRLLVLALLAVLAAAGCGRKEGPQTIRVPAYRLPPPERGR